MAADTLSDAIPLLRRYLEATYRLSEPGDLTGEPDELRGQWLAAHVAAARRDLYDYLLAHGWSPPPGEMSGQQVLESIVRPVGGRSGRPDLDIEIDLDRIPSERRDR